MKFLYSTIALFSLLLANNVEARWKPTPQTTWNYVLGHDVDVSAETAKVVDIDVRKSVEKIQKLHNAGIKVICYFSAGTLEDFRDDYDQYMSVKGLVKEVYDDWPDERWLDFRVPGLKPLITKRMKLAVSKKCDGIEVDNLDAYQMDIVKRWKDPITKEDTIEFAKWLGGTAHSLGISIGLKNVVGIIDDVAGYYDFAINEDCARHNECYHYNNFLRSGKAVFGVTYNGISKNRKALCSNLSGLGMSMIVKEKDKLVQEGLTFNGKAQCGSGFSNSVGNAVKPGSKPVTTTKKHTTTTTKKHTTTTKKHITTTTKKHTTTTKKHITTTTKKPTTAKRVTTAKKVTTTKRVVGATRRVITKKVTTTTKKPVTTTKRISKKATTTTKRPIHTKKGNTKKPKTVKRVKVVTKVVTKKVIINN